MVFQIAPYEYEFLTIGLQVLFYSNIRGPFLSQYTYWGDTGLKVCENSKSSFSKIGLITTFAFWADPSQLFCQSCCLKGTQNRKEKFLIE